MKKITAPFRFKGGVHPADNKELSNAAAVVPLPVPAQLAVPLLQHLGAPATPLVEVGAEVKRGQPIGAAAGFISAAVHAPTSGTVKAIEDRPTSVGRTCPHVIIEADGRDERVEPYEPWPDWEKRSGKELVARVAEAGIVGMGGAGFPTHVKLSPPPDKPIDTLIINGAECEPYLTGDHRKMLEYAREIWEGCRILRHILKVNTVRIAIEDNKPDAIEAIRQAIGEVEGDVAVVELETIYPQGSEKQQIYGITGREVPSAGLPMDVGCLVENVGTTYAIWNAVVNGYPLDERIVTVTGRGVPEPRNYRARVGVAFQELIAASGGILPNVTKIVAGGPMMGFAQHTLEVSVNKTTSGIVALPADEVNFFTSKPCISCGRCNNACPLYLLPSELAHCIEADDIPAAEALNLMDCFECGACAYVCPAHRPLVQHMRRAKAAVMLKRRLEKTKS